MNGDFLIEIAIHFSNPSICIIVLGLNPNLFNHSCVWYWRPFYIFVPIMVKFSTLQTPAIAMAVICMMTLFVSGACMRNGHSKDDAFRTSYLSDTISRIVADYHGEIGVALILNDTDTVCVNDTCIYPIMSVFKLHQALALCNEFDTKGVALDTLVSIRRTDLDSATWSPMLKEHPESVISLTVGELLRYSLMQSDNNASNIMFRRLADVEMTDSFIATIIPRNSFKISYTEEEMSVDHGKAYSNRTSPSGAAMLINRLFTDSLVSPDKQQFITTALSECQTGTDRIAAPLLGIEGLMIAHKTGSGYKNKDGVLVAHNDVAYVRLPHGTRYALAVFVKDFHGIEKQASEAIARISSAVYSVLSHP